jgi:hypothetical protein
VGVLGDSNLRHRHRFRRGIASAMKYFAAGIIIGIVLALLLSI